VATVATGRRDNFLAVLFPFDAFDLPNVRLDPGVLQLADGLDHQCGE
jgi:hypothetical protein